MPFLLKEVGQTDKKPRQKHTEQYQISFSAHVSGQGLVPTYSKMVYVPQVSLYVDQIESSVEILPAVDEHRSNVRYLGC